jgi:hypothetical protein
VYWRPFSLPSGQVAGEGEGGFVLAGTPCTGVAVPRSDQLAVGLTNQRKGGILSAQESRGRLAARAEGPVRGATPVVACQREVVIVGVGATTAKVGGPGGDQLAVLNSLPTARSAVSSHARATARPAPPLPPAPPPAWRRIARVGRRQFVQCTGETCSPKSWAASTNVATTPVP